MWDPRVCVCARARACVYTEIQLPIITPAYPQLELHFNVTRSTRSVILNEFKRGTCIVVCVFNTPFISWFLFRSQGLEVCTGIVMGGHKAWEELFEPANFFVLYK